MSKQICVEAGKAAGSCVRGVVELTRKTGKVGEVVKKCAVSTVDATKRFCAKVGNLFKRVSTDGQLAAWTEKQKDVFLQLGEQVFLGYQQRIENLLEQENIKNLLEQASECEKHKSEIKEAIVEQKRKMDEIVIFKRAKENLESQDPRMRRVAIRVFERLGDRKAIPLLTKALEDPDEEVRKHAREVLHKLINSAKQEKPEQQSQQTPA